MKKIFGKNTNKTFKKNSYLLFFMVVLVNQVLAQKGPYLKLSLGPGLSIENSYIKSNGFAVMTKNHALGWGISDKFALQFGEFGGLIKQKVGEYDYINIDPFGLGFSYRFSNAYVVSVMGAYGKISLARKWTEATGTKIAKGGGANISVDKEWVFAKHWAFRAGPQIYWFQASPIDSAAIDKFNFFTASFNVSLLYYLTPREQV